MSSTAVAGGSRSCATIASVGGGRNKCDPPVYISGRRGLRPSLLRDRDRTDARERVPPVQSTKAIPHDGEAHPSCDRLRGSLRSGDMSPRGEL